jgi:hypothetical protein
LRNNETVSFSYQYSAVSIQFFDGSGHYAGGGTPNSQYLYTKGQDGASEYP